VKTLALQAAGGDPTPLASATLAGFREYLKNNEKEVKKIVVSTLIGSGLRVAEKIGHR
jgi:hypothetical protein